MRIYSPPVHKDGFSYYGSQLEVNGKPRCSSERLYELLTWEDHGPLLNKAGRPRLRQPPPHKDETGAFYQAQCVHYGLTEGKTKQAAKKVLLQALDANHRVLVVPPSIMKLEKELKAQFEAANEAAKNCYEEERK